MNNLYYSSSLFSNYYIEYLNDNNLIKDEAQYKLVLDLNHIKSNIDNYLKRSDNFFLKYFTNKAPSVYIYGNSGSGKSMIVELFYNSIDHNLKNKYHFQSFISFLYKENEALNKYSIKNITKNIVKKYKLLYIDEIEIYDISDAVIFFSLLHII